MQEEFYAIAFRKKIYTSIEDMQLDADKWITFYNEERTHSGRYCYGKTPLQTWMDSKSLAKDKNIDLQFGQNPNFNVSEQTETGSAGEQPVRDSLTGGNEKSDAKPASDFINSFSL